MAEHDRPEDEVSDRPMSTADFATAGQDRPIIGRQDQAEAPVGQDGPAPLLPETESGDLRRQWDSIQTGFVDEPRRAVQDADALVAGAMKRLAEVFASERSQLEGQWDRGDDVSTEDLRIALQRYRAFFERLLAI